MNYTQTGREVILVAREKGPAYGNLTIRNSKDAADLLRKIWTPDLEIRESGFMILMNVANRVTGWVHLSTGSICGTMIDPIIVAKYAVESLSKKIIIAHNHPSGNTTPSAPDNLITKKILDGLALFDIKLEDHIILTRNEYFSFADDGSIIF